jgi:ribosomal protein S12 methylthiotransferase accessory factor
VSGVGYDQNQAIITLLGEAIERYTAFNYGTLPLHFAPPGKNTKEYLDPTEVVGAFDQKNIGGREVKLDPDKDISWLEGIDLFSGNSVYVPALLSLLSAGFERPGEQFFDMPISTGLAAGPSLEWATKAGLLEVIERDAIAVHWLLKRPVQKILNISDFLDDLPTAAKELLTFEGPLEAEVYKLQNALDMPAVIVRLKATRKDAGYSLGAAVSDTWVDAISKAVREVYHVWHSYASYWPRNSQPISLDEIKTYVDHGRYYFSSVAAHSTQWFFDGNGVNVADSRAESISLDGLIAACSKEKLRVLRVDLTTPDVQSLGFSVVRILVPNLQPLTCGSGRTIEDLRRLAPLLEKLRAPNRVRINADPHPFA